MSVPYTFASATTSIPLSELDANFATPINLGSTSIVLGGSYTEIDGLNLNNATLVDPALGTPVSGNLANCTGYTFANLSGTVPIWNQDTTGNAATATAATSAMNAVNATRIINADGWDIVPNGTTLTFSYNGTTVASLDSSGNLITTANITAYGTP